MEFQQWWNNLLLWVNKLFSRKDNRKHAAILKREYGNFCAILCCDRDEKTAVYASTWRVVPRRGDFHLLITADTLTYKDLKLRQTYLVDYASNSPSHRITISFIAVTRPKISLYKLYCADVDLQGIYAYASSDRLAQVTAQALAQAILKFNPHTYEILEPSESLKIKLFTLYGTSKLNYDDLSVKWVAFLCQVNWLRHLREIAAGYLGSKHEI